MDPRGQRVENVLQWVGSKLHSSIQLKLSHVSIPNTAGERDFIKVFEPLNNVCSDAAGVAVSESCFGGGGRCCCCWALCHMITLRW